MRRFFTFAENFIFWCLLTLFVLFNNYVYKASYNDTHFKLKIDELKGMRLFDYFLYCFSFFIVIFIIYYVLRFVLDKIQVLKDKEFIEKHSKKIDIFVSVIMIFGVCYFFILDHGISITDNYTFYEDGIVTMLRLRFAYFMYFFIPFLFEFLKYHYLYFKNIRYIQGIFFRIFFIIIFLYSNDEFYFFHVFFVLILSAIYLFIQLWNEKEIRKILIVYLILCCFSFFLINYIHVDFYRNNTIEGRMESVHSSYIIDNCKWSGSMDNYIVQNFTLFHGGFIYEYLYNEFDMLLFNFGLAGYGSYILLFLLLFFSLRIDKRKILSSAFSFIFSIILFLIISNLVLYLLKFNVFLFPPLVYGMEFCISSLLTTVIMLITLYLKK